jgi:hypothetical protein
MPFRSLRFRILKKAKKEKIKRENKRETRRGEAKNGGKCCVRRESEGRRRNRINSDSFLKRKRIKTKKLFERFRG